MLSDSCLVGKAKQNLLLHCRLCASLVRVVLSFNDLFTLGTKKTEKFSSTKDKKFLRTTTCFYVLSRIHFSLLFAVVHTGNIGTFFLKVPVSLFCSTLNGNK